ncbi:MAG: PIG-L family deacetylase [Oscillospiraceae bacterium]|jgi:LmbE family N-acetylglucosaminyl deacetylase|nr:PIG-L family deacetylase [Oscillospiraceae bacterium]
MKILTIAAHPDDEILGCGGFINRLTDSKDVAECLILATGATSRHTKENEESEKEIILLHNNAKEATSTIGYSEIYFEKFPDNRMDDVDLLDIIKIIENHIEKIKPDMILTHHCNDLNIDHKITFQAVITACRPMAGSYVKKILSFETPSATEWQFPYHKNSFAPNVFIDITENLEIKLKALSHYESEMRDTPHPRSNEKIRALAEYRGGIIGVKYAEAYELIYEVL